MMRVLLVSLILSSLLHAQSLSLTNAARHFISLTNAAVTLAGRSELWVTSDLAPLSGCNIQLDSPDAWLFLPGVAASRVEAGYLGQIGIHGAPAVSGGNVRVVQYGQGAVVVPHPADFAPLAVYDQPHFVGNSANLPANIYQRGADLGGFLNNIHSFILKRGYMAVFAQDATGVKWSRSYVAQDGDLEVALLPSTLDGKIQFIHVVPWRWVGKKGVAGEPGISKLNVGWNYNWNISSRSTLDLEYVPIRQNQWWPGLSQNWASLGANTLLGYNEPDNAGQANMSVATAIAAWPDLLATGLRIGSPAPTDGGRYGWLYPFVQQADAAGLRVDFAAVHYYWGANPSDPNGAAGQMYNFLLDVYNNTRRPVWVTEWNNGANWTDNNPWPVPSYAQQQACVAAMISMLDSTPFVERYAFYNWVEDPRSLITSANSVTAAGTTYSNEVSHLSHRQMIPDSGAPAAAQYLFDGDGMDTSGFGNHAIVVGAPDFVDSPHGRAVVMDGVNQCVELPETVGKGAHFTFAAWVKWDGGAGWQRIMDFGNDTSHYLFLTPSSGSGTLRFAINNGGGEQMLETAALPVGVWRHVCVTINGQYARLYVNGAPKASSSSFTLAPAAVGARYNYLGKSQFPADPLFSGSLAGVEIADYAFSPSQITALLTNQAPQFVPAALPVAVPGQPYSTQVNQAFAVTTPGESLTFTKVSGPPWLIITSDGALIGAPNLATPATNYVAVRAVASSGQSAFGTLVVKVEIPPALTVSGGDGKVVIRWPSSYLGWRLQVQTNATLSGGAADWIELPGSNGTNAWTAPTAPNRAFYRLATP
jgi:Glycosyl hydrolase catalytic core/Concanavalin A-like lectin/glucanases superfamily/Putative Ig domain